MSLVKLTVFIGGIVLLMVAFMLLIDFALVGWAVALGGMGAVIMAGVWVAILKEFEEGLESEVEGTDKS